MMKFLILFLASITLFTIVIKSNNNPIEKPKAIYKLNPDRDKHNWWYCPDNVKGFPPVNIEQWNKVPVINGRLPTKDETENGTSLIYYDDVVYPDAKAYDITLPKLAWLHNYDTNKKDTVIIIQVVQTNFDTIAGYRFLTGGNGTHDFRDLHIFSDEEIEIAVGE